MKPSYIYICISHEKDCTLPLMKRWSGGLVDLRRGKTSRVKVRQGMFPRNYAKLHPPVALQTVGYHYPSSPWIPRLLTIRQISLRTIRRVCAFPDINDRDRILVFHASIMPSLIALYQIFFLMYYTRVDEKEKDSCQVYR